MKSRQAASEATPHGRVLLPAGSIVTMQIGGTTVRDTVQRYEPEHSRGSVPMRSATQHRHLTGATDMTVLAYPTPDADGAR